MSDLRTAAQQALEALNSIDVGYRSPSGDPLEVSFDEVKCEAAIAALRAALAQQDEPCPNCASLEAQNAELDRNLAELEQAHGIIESEIRVDKA